MSKFKITLMPLGRVEKHASLGASCDSLDTASELANGLAELMPGQTYFCQKNSRDITSGWFGQAEELVKVEAKKSSETKDIFTLLKEAIDLSHDFDKDLEYRNSEGSEHREYERGFGCGQTSFANHLKEMLNEWEKNHE
jgi:hypothetical protein